MAKGITPIKTVKTMHSDLKRLTELLEKYPHINPEAIFGGATNEIMYKFMQKISKSLVLDDVSRPEDALQATSKGGDWREHYFLMDTDLFMQLVDMAKNTVNYREFYKLMLKRKK